MRRRISLPAIALAAAAIFPAKAQSGAEQPPVVVVPDNCYDAIIRAQEKNRTYKELENEGNDRVVQLMKGIIQATIADVVVDILPSCSGVRLPDPPRIIRRLTP